METTPPLKTCAACHTPKALSEFHRKQGRCKSCRLSASKEWKSRDRAVANGYRKKCETKYPGKEDLRKRKWQSDHGRDWYLKSTYGLTEEQVKDILTVQAERCPICQRLFADIKHKRSSAQVDHCHSTDVIRGIICYVDNVLLAMLEQYRPEDRLRVCAAALQYLAETESPEVPPVSKPVDVTTQPTKL